MMHYRFMYRYLDFEVIFSLCLHGRIMGYLEDGSNRSLRVCTNIHGATTKKTVILRVQPTCTHLCTAGTFEMKAVL